ncbi:MAG: MerR family transcriptional regulator [Eubacterium sp.]|nr:MerR family transcriptional regulator [Eubacterium sp.]
MEGKRYMISDTSKMLGIESHVLRYWEEELDIVIPRNEMGHRYYTEFHINLLRNVKKLKQQGYGLRAIKMMISDPNTEVHIEERKKLREFPEISVGEGKERLEVTEVSENTKLSQFQKIMDGIVEKAMKESTKNLGKELSDYVSQNVLKGMNYMMRVQDEKEEARYKRLDELLRSRQKETRKERRIRLRAEKNLAKEIRKTKLEKKEKEGANAPKVEAPA